MLVNFYNVKKQSGMVLVLALVMLAVLTLIGVASMDSSSLELKVAANTQEHEVAFQAAQTVIAFVTSEDPENTIDYHDVSATAQTISYPPASNSNMGDLPADEQISGSATVTRVGCSAGIGDSLEEGKGTKYNFYNAQVVGLNVTGSSNSVQMQGVRYFAAGC